MLPIFDEITIKMCNFQEDKEAAAEMFQKIANAYEVRLAKGTGRLLEN